MSQQGEQHASVSERPFISMVIPVRNEAASIEACLDRCLDQTYPADRFEVIVVDGASEDATLSILEARAAHDPRILVLRNPDRNTPAALNIGIRAARGELIAWMSGHATPERTYLERALAGLLASGGWCFGGQMKRVGETAVQRAIAIASSSPIGLGNAVHHYGTEARWVETAYPGFWPRWVFERVGLFDLELVRNQDDELSFRIRQTGGGIWYDPSVVIEYRARGSLGKAFSQYRQYGMWKVRVFQKHPAAARVRQFVPAALVGVVAIGLLVGVVWPAAALVALAAGSAYGVFVAAGSLWLSRRGASPVLLVGALVAIHLGYGIGFWQGLVRFAPRWLVDRRGRVERLEPADRAESTVVARAEASVDRAEAGRA